MYKESARQKMWVLDHTPMPAQKHKTVYSPLHYSDTVEILLIRGIKGEVVINGRPFTLEEKNVFFIPPQCPHASVFRQGGEKEGDMIIAFHVTPAALAHFLDIDRILSADNLGLFPLSVAAECFDTVYALILSILRDGRPLISRLGDLLQLLSYFENGRAETIEPPVRNHCAVAFVDWIEANYASRLTVADAAMRFGYHPHYFCKWVRQQTGTTFNSFLNAVRINHACAALLSGCSIAQAAERCGFADASYFTKVFQRTMGKTPRAYVRQHAGFKT